MANIMSNAKAVEMYVRRKEQSKDPRYTGHELTDHINQHKVAQYQSVLRAQREIREKERINYDYYRLTSRTGYYVAIPSNAISNIISEDENGNMILEGETNSNDVAA